MCAVPVKIQKGTKLPRLTVVESAQTYASMVKAGPEATPSASEKKAKLDKVLAELKFDNWLLGHENARQKLRFIAEKYLEAFPANDSYIGKVQMVEHHIYVGDAQPVRAKARFYSPVQRGYQRADRRI
jgi:hypothetical protein